MYYIDWTMAFLLASFSLKWIFQQNKYFMCPVVSGASHGQTANDQIVLKSLGTSHLPVILPYQPYTVKNGLLQ